MKRCPICQGEQVIRLPWRERRVADFRNFDATAPEPVESVVRAYPCPECAPSTSPERLAVVTVGAERRVHPEHIAEPSIRSSMRRELATMLGMEMLKSNLIRFGQDQPHAIKGDWAAMWPVRATAGVVAPAQVATLEERIAAHDNDLRQQVVTEVQKRIDVWGASLNPPWHSISKGDAIEEVTNAFDAVLKRRREIKPL